MAKLTGTATVPNISTTTASVTIPVIFLGTEGDDFLKFFGSTIPSYSPGNTYLGSIFTGYGGNDVMLGSHGHDSMGGGSGNDFFKGYYGNDIINGGSGTDTVDYSYYGHNQYTWPRTPWGERNLGVTLDLQNGYSEGRRSLLQDNDTLISIENAIGSDFNDVIYGSNSVNDLRGRQGDDYIFGFEGDDILNGEEGADLLFGGQGQDMLTGGLGFDRISGNEGIDTVNYRYSTVGFDISLTLGTANGGAADTDNLIDIENVWGSNFNDSIEGTNARNVITGYGGNDYIVGLGGDDDLYGGNGDDVLVGGLGADLIDGGQGFDSAEYAGSTAGVAINLSTGLGVGGEAAGDRFYDIEKLVGSVYADQLTGNFASNQFFGLGGQDTLNGDLGNDQLYGGDDADLILGGEGNDTLFGETGADALDGGAGIDSANYTDSNAAVRVNLTSGTGLGGEAQGDILQNIENLGGSLWDDVLTGNSGNNLLNGFFGNDTLNGAGGHDHLVGFDGIDTLLGGAGDDMIEGGWGTDQVNGGIGADYIVGNEGGDNLTGGLGADRFVFQLVADSNTNTGIDSVTDFMQGQDLIDLGGLDANSALPFDNAFAFMGNSAAPLAQGQLRFSHVNGNTLIEAEVDGFGGVDVSITLTGIISLNADDFIL
jgi:Ca2+-binding RTX toxin-like protein